MAFCASMGDKYRELLKTGDMAAEDKPRATDNWKNKRTKAEREKLHEHLEQFRAALESGASIIDTCLQAGVPKSTLARHAWTRGWKVDAFDNAPRRKQLQITRQMIHEKPKDVTFQELCKKHGICYMTFLDARQRLRNMGDINQ